MKTNFYIKEVTLAMAALFSTFPCFAMEKPGNVQLRVTNNTAKNYQLRSKGAPIARLEPGLSIPVRVNLDEVLHFTGNRSEEYPPSYTAVLTIYDPENAKPILMINLNAEMSPIGTNVVFDATLSDPTDRDTGIDPATNPLNQSIGISIPKNDFSQTFTINDFAKVLFMVNIRLFEENGRLEATLDASSSIKGQ